jgi:hypothetical protein
MTEVACECQRIHVTMTHVIFYLKKCSRPTSVTKIRHGTQLLARRDTQIRNMTLSAKRFDTQIRN